jgi:hypothetical protein
MSLFKDAISDHLTEAPHDRAARATHPGMAHFAGTGPHGKTCRECSFWAHTQYDYRSKNGKYAGEIKPASCKKFRALMHEEGPQIPHMAAACKYFEQNEAVPGIFQK